MPPRNANPADLVKYYSDLIMDSRRKLEEALAEIAEYSDQLRRVATETSHRLISKG
jgi:hypothetical protein